MKGLLLLLFIYSYAGLVVGGVCILRFFDPGISKKAKLKFALLCGPLFWVLFYPIKRLFIWIMKLSFSI